MNRAHPVARAAWALALALFVAVVAGALALAPRGLDRTDEGLYLNTISHPSDDPATILLFGYVYHPAYAVLGGDIAALRSFGMLLTVALGAVTAWTVLGRTRLAGVAGARGRRLVLSLLIGATGLLVIVGMPLSPGYNSLALQGLLVTTTGLALALFDEARTALVGWSVLGLGGALTFLGKPTTALALVVLLVAVGLATFGPWLKGLPVAVLACVAALVVCTRGDLGSVASQLAAGIDASTAMGGHDDLIRWDTPFHKASFLLPALAVVGGVGVGLSLVEHGGRVLRGLGGAVLGLAVAAAGVSVWWWVQRDSALFSMSDAPTLVLLVLGLSALGLRGVRTKANGEAAPTGDPAAAGSSRQSQRAFILLLLFLLALPAAFAFGTNVNLWSAQGRAAIFWVLAATLLLARRPTPLVLAPGLAALLLVGTYVIGTALGPYRYPPLLEATTRAEVTPAGATLLLTPEDADRTRALLAEGARLGIGQNTWILDLTGDSPGYIHELGARAAGRAWNLGGYPGSIEATLVALAQQPCRLTGSWLLVSSAGRRSVDPAAVLGRFGLSVDDYTVAGTFERIGWAFGGPSYVDTAQILKPRGTLAVSACPADR